MASATVPKSVLITGCSPGGIGYALAVALHERGWKVIATARSTDAIAALDAIGIQTVPLEVTNDESIASCFKHTRSATNGRGLDMFINNAGVSYTVAALDMNISEVRQIFDTNVFAVMALCQTFTPLLMQAKGTIVMIGSLAGVIPYVFGAGYNASKAALHQYANTLRVELAPFDVKVITVVTGGVASQLTKHVTRSLPPDSYYSQLEDVYQERQKHSASVGITPDQYAKDVLPQILPGGGPWPWRWFLRDARKKWIWAGGQSGRVWFLSGGWLWSSVFDVFFTLKFKLNTLKEKHKTA
ncbi:uncharacterized protein HMPREF1541_01621 [Cyphellophora europaea CBS 101466]|uniref:Uncharacterized protein n=1 Tax=Cyphellophora europaea (strain CBS 101466) TaxID=1220924 RepID=W2S1L1_CYPE1|nr:uncharacterized protein HMPREF1541_01621 [Cyphellophora europaea CBS 101466]ETN42465.1 hypothetical protein HMPREF1541_01621 [Cyphellophora europaea CBS 101466]